MLRTPATIGCEIAPRGLATVQWAHDNLRGSTLAACCLRNTFGTRIFVWQVELVLTVILPIAPRRIGEKQPHGTPPNEAKPSHTNSHRHPKDGGFLPLIRKFQKWERSGSQQYSDEQRPRSGSYQAGLAQVPIDELTEAKKNSHRPIGNEGREILQQRLRQIGDCPHPPKPAFLRCSIPELHNSSIEDAIRDRSPILLGGELTGLFNGGIVQP